MAVPLLASVGGSILKGGISSILSGRAASDARDREARLMKQIAELETGTSLEDRQNPNTPNSTTNINTSTSGGGGTSSSGTSGTGGSGGGGGY